MAAIFGERPVAFPWLEPPRFTAPAEDDPAPTTPPVELGVAEMQACVEAAAKVDGLAPREQDAKRRRDSVNKWVGIVKDMGVNSKLYVTVTKERGDLGEVVADVLATRAEATLRSRAWPIGQYVKWCRDGKVEPYPFSEKRCYEYLKHLADSKKRRRGRLASSRRRSLRTSSSGLKVRRPPFKAKGRLERPGVLRYGRRSVTSAGRPSRLARYLLCKTQLR